MTTSLPRLRRSVTPIRQIKRRTTITKALNSEENRAKSPEAKNFLSAIGLGMRESVQEIIKRKKCSFLVKDPRGYNAVHLAVKGNDVGLLELLCEMGKVPPGVPIREDLHITSIHRAAKFGSLQALKYLIEKAKVNPHTKDNLGRNALFYAAKKGHLDVVAYLVSTVKVNPRLTQRDTGDSVLHVATRAGFQKVAIWLMENTDLDPHVSNFKSRNCLHLAVKANNLELVKYVHRRKEVHAFLPDEKNMTAVGYSAVLILRLPIFRYFLNVLGVETLILGDPMVTRSLWDPPPTPFELAKRSHNTSALHLITRAQLCQAKIKVCWVNSKLGKLPAPVLITITSYF